MDTNTNSSRSTDDEFSNKEETSQQWIFRHLIEFTNCEDESAKNLVDGDCSPLIQLLTDITQKKSLFITITVPAKNDIVVQSDPPPTTITQIAPKPFGRKKKFKKPKKKKIKKLKGSKTKKQIRKKEKIVEISEPIEATLPISPGLDMIFEWWTAHDLPPHEQFIFIIPKNQVPNTETHLDELYHVGFMKNRKLLNTALLCVSIVFNGKESFASKIDLLLLINEVDDRKIPRELICERFVIDNIARNFNLNGRQRNIESEVRSINHILAQTIQSFCVQHDNYDRLRLLIQISFLDIEFLGFLSNIPLTALRLERALNHLSILHHLFKDDVSEWTRKTFLYLLDLFSTILAHEITRKSNFMTNYSPEKKVGPICVSFKNVVQKLVKISREIFETQEDWAATNKISFSFYIVGILEEEIDSIIKKIKEMNSVKRDMSQDRSAMKATQVILSELDEYLQEKCLESAVESGNLESLRTLAATIVKHNKRLERVVALY